MFDKLRELLPANRLAALTGLVVAAIAFLVSINESLVPGSPPAEAIGKAIVALGSVLGAIRVITKFMEGSQNWDSLMHAGVPKQPGVSAAPAQDAEVVVTDHPPVKLANEERDLHDRPGTGL